MLATIILICFFIVWPWDVTYVVKENKEWEKEKKAYYVLDIR